MRRGRTGGASVEPYRNIPRGHTHSCKTNHKQN